MEEIVKNVLRKLDKNATLTQIKETLKSECNKATFEVNKTDWIDMFDKIIISLN